MSELVKTDETLLNPAQIDTDSQPSQAHQDCSKSLQMANKSAFAYAEGAPGGDLLIPNDTIQASGDMPMQAINMRLARKQFFSTPDNNFSSHQHSSTQNRSELNYTESLQHPSAPLYHNGFSSTAAYIYCVFRVFVCMFHRWPLLAAPGIFYKF